MISKIFRKVAGLRVLPDTMIETSRFYTALHCYLPNAAREEKTAVTPAGTAVYVIDKRTDGKTFLFDSLVERNGQTTRSTVTATLVAANLYDIQSIVIDDRPQPLRSRAEILSALRFLGYQHIRGIGCGRLPRPAPAGGVLDSLDRGLKRLWA